MIPGNRFASHRLPAHPASCARSRRTVLLAGLGCAAGTPTLASPPAALERWPARLPTPDLDLPRLEGGRFRLADARGQVILLNFWASWCQPCVEELPALELLAARHAEQGLYVVAINFKQVARTVARFIERQGLSLPVLLDTDGAAAIGWNARILPTSVVIDRQGRAALIATGDPDWTGTAVREALKPLW